MTTSEGDTESDGVQIECGYRCCKEGLLPPVAPRCPDVHPFFHPVLTSFQGKDIKQRSTSNDARVDAEAQHFLRQCVEKDKVPRTVFARKDFFLGGSCSEWVWSLLMAVVSNGVVHKVEAMQPPPSLFEKGRYIRKL